MIVDVSPELLRPLLFFSLLLGPTLAWVLLRVLRGPTSRSGTAGESGELADQWVCGICHSVNLSGASRCYRGCSPAASLPTPDVVTDGAAPLVAVGPGAPPVDVRPAAPLVAVGPGAPPVALSPAAPPEPRREPERVAMPVGVAAVAMEQTEAIDRTGPGSAARPGSAGDPRVTRSAGAPTPAHPTSPVIHRATKRQGAPVMGVVPAPPSGRPANSPVPVTASHPAAGTPTVDPSETCPHLGLRRDALTHFQFPDPEHRCYASGSPVKVDVERQQADCFGPYQQCIRYRAYHGVLNGS